MPADAPWVAQIKAVAQVDPARGVQMASAAEARARQQPRGPGRSRDILTAQWLRAQSLIGMNRTDEAAPIVTSALQALPAVAIDTKLQGDLLMTRARIDVMRGNAGKALADYQAAYRIFTKAGIPRSQAVCLISIGSIYQDASDFERVLYYYNLAQEAYSGDKFITLSIRNNQANALKGLNRFPEAVEKYRQALALATTMQSPLIEVKVLNNLAATQLEAKDLPGAATTLEHGLRLVRQPAAADWKPQLLGTQAKLALAEHRPAEAVRLVEQALGGRNPDKLLDQSDRNLHETAYRAYQQAGNEREALRHLETLSKLDEEARSVVTKTSAALLAARFDFANQNARIATLRTGQLQRDIALARLQARQNLIILGGLLAVVTTVAGLLVLYLRALRRSRDTVRRANAELAQANVELEHALTAKSRFLATTSHEIRTPLNGVLGMTQVLLADTGVQGGTRDRIALVHSAGETMRGLVDDILEFAKIDAGKLEIERSRVDLPALLADVLEFWRGPAQAKQLSLELRADALPDTIIEDGRRLRQVLDNLVSNAIKFTATGGIVVTAEASNDRLSLSIVDTGIGIAPDALEMIFDMFTQVDTTTTRQFGGTGLGLAISRSIAEALGGSLTVASAPGAGSTFSVSLPLVVAESLAPVAPRPVTLHAEQLLQARVALIGGNPIQQSIIRNLLAGQVGGTVTAASLAAAREQREVLDADLMIIDQIGLEAADIAAFLGTSGTRVVVIADPGAAPVPGVDRMLARPLSGAALLAALRELFIENDSPDVLVMQTLGRRRTV